MTSGLLVLLWCQALGFETIKDADLPDSGCPRWEWGWLSPAPAGSPSESILRNQLSSPPVKTAPSLTLQPANPNLILQRRYCLSSSLQPSREACPGVDMHWEIVSKSTAIHEGKAKGFLSALLILAADALCCSGSSQADLRLCPQGCLAAGLRECSAAAHLWFGGHHLPQLHWGYSSPGTFSRSICRFFRGKYAEICSREMLNKSSPIRSNPLTKPIQNQCRKILQPLKICWFLCSINPLYLGQLCPNTMVSSPKISIDIFNTELIFAFFLM